MEYRFFHNRPFDPGAEEHKVLEAAIALSLKDRDENFLIEAASFISSHTGTRYVCIGLLTSDNKHIQTCAFVQHNRVLSNITYSLQGTPCDAVLIQQFCYFPFNVTQKFPEDRELRELQIESYLGSILLDESSDPVGIIAMMDVKPIENVGFAEHLILVLSPAIEEELTRLRSAGTAA